MLSKEFKLYQSKKLLLFGNMNKTLVITVIIFI